MRDFILSRKFWGFLIVILGTIFLLSSLNIVGYSYIWATWWPLFIIFLGVVMILNRPSSYVVPVFILLIGVMLQVDRLGILEVNVFKIFWPLLIIVAGLSILLHKSPTSKTNKKASTDTETNLFAVLSGIDSKITSSEYKGGKATALMGGITLDLRKADIKDDATLSLLTIMGGIELRVPETWIVRVSGTPLLGGWENGTTKPTAKDAPVLIIDATCVMGGVEIKN